MKVDGARAGFSLAWRSFTYFPTAVRSRSFDNGDAAEVRGRTEPEARRSARYALFLHV
jgi:hypothetical protein